MLRVHKVVRVTVGLKQAGGNVADVNDRISVEWQSGDWREATVSSFDAVSGEHCVQYDAEEEVTLVLTEGRPEKETGNWRICSKAKADSDAALELASQLQRALCFLGDSEQSFYDPMDLVEACGCLNLNFSIYQQNDASEFCDQLLDRVEKALKDTPYKKLVDTCFCVKLCSEKVMKGCAHRREKADITYKVQLKIQGKASVIEALDAYVEGELMDGDNQVMTWRACVSAPDVILVVCRCFAKNATRNETPHAEIASGSYLRHWCCISCVSTWITPFLRL